MQFSKADQNLEKADTDGLHRVLVITALPLELKAVLAHITALDSCDSLITNADGSLDFYIQTNTPGAAKEATGLPVAMGPFTLLMRLYSPRSAVLDGSRTPPAVRRIN
jgi:hypothetical protein